MKKVLAVVLSLMMVFSILPVSVMAQESVTLTHTQFVNASDRYEKFIARNAGVPNFVTSDNQKLSVEEFLYAAADAITDLAEGKKISATYKKLAEVTDSVAKESIVSGELNRGEYIALAKAVITETDANGEVSACFGTSLGAISPKNLSYVFAQVIQYYKYNKALPAAVEVDSWVGAFYDAPETAPEAVTPVETTVRVAYFINAALRVKSYIEAHGKLPKLTQVEGQSFTMGSFLATALKVYLSGATKGNEEVVYANNPEYPVELIAEALELNKTQLDELFTAADNAVDTSAPASVKYGEDVIGFNTLVYAVANALAEVRNNGSVSSLTIADWEDVSGEALPLPGSEPPVVPVDPTAPRVYALHSVAVMGNWLENYLRNYGADLDVIADNGTWISGYVSLELTRLSSAEAFLTLANTVNDLKDLTNFKEYEGTVVYEGLKPVDFASKEDFATGTVTKAEYLSIVDQILSYAAANGNLLPETTYCGLGGLGYETTMLLLVDVVQYADKMGVLPESIEIEKTWLDISYNPLPTPVPTEAVPTDAPVETSVPTEDPSTPVPTVEATEDPTPVPTVEATEDPTPVPTVEATEKPATEADGIFTIAEIAAASQAAVNGYTSGTPFYKEGITIDGLTVTQPSYYILAAKAIQDIYNNNTDATYASASLNYNEPTLVANYDIKKADGSAATEATQTFYMNFAIRQTVYVTTGGGAATSTAGASASYPTTSGNANGFAVSDYSGQMTYEAGLLMFARVLSYYAANGTLPASVALEYVPAVESTDAPAETETPTVAPTTAAPAETETPTVAPTTEAPAESDGIFTIAELAQASKAAVEGYNSGKPFYKEGVTVDGVVVPQHVYYYMIATALQDVYNNKTTATYTVDAYKCNPYEGEERNYDLTRNGSTPTEATQALYMNFAIRQTKYILGAGAGTIGAIASYPTSDSNANGFAVSDYSGQLTYEVGILMMARALSAYATNGTLPASVALEYVPSVESTEAPATTETPATTDAPATSEAPAAQPTGHPAFSTVASGTTFSVAEIAAAAKQIITHFEAYKALEGDDSIAKAVIVDGKCIKDQDWAYMAAYAICGLSGAYSASGLSGYTAATEVAYKSIIKPGVNAGTQYTGSLTLAQVAEAAWKACANYANNNGGQAAASCGSIAGVTQLSYYTILLAEARVLDYYATNGTLPASVAVDAVYYAAADSDSNVDANASITTAAPVTTVAPTTAAPTVAPTTAAPTVAPTTEAPANSGDPAATPTAAPAFNYSALKTNSSTFTVKEVADAAATIVSHYDTYKHLAGNLSVAKAVPVGGYILTDEYWMYMAAYALNGLSGAYATSGLSGYTANTTVVYKTIGKPTATVSKPTIETLYTGATLTLAQLTEAAWKVCTVNALKLTASCDSVEGVEQLSYYTILVATARALKHFADNGTLPAAVQCDAITFLRADT